MNSKVETLQHLIKSLKENLKKVIEHKAQPISKSQLEQFNERQMSLLLELRKNHRHLYLGIDHFKQNNQNQKDNLDRITVQAECLEY